MSTPQMLSIETLVERNKKYAETHTPLPDLMMPDGKPRPNAGMLIITCVDPRVHPEKFLGFGGWVGGSTEAPLAMPIVRNIGGRTKRAITDIVGLDAVFGIRQVMVIHHTDCGMSHGTDGQMQEVVSKRVPDDASVKDWEFGEIKDLKQSVIDDIKVLKDSPYVRKEIVVRGFVFDVKDGSMEEISSGGKGQL